MKRFLGILLTALAAAVCLFSLTTAPRGLHASYAASGREGAFSTPVPPDGVIRINAAETEELIELPGIGETLAAAILDEREQNGPFHYAEDLISVKGIGPAKLKEIFPFISLEQEF